MSIFEVAEQDGLDIRITWRRSEVDVAPIWEFQNGKVICNIAPTGIVYEVVIVNTQLVDVPITVDDGDIDAEVRVAGEAVIASSVAVVVDSNKLPVGL